MRFGLWLGIVLAFALLWTPTAASGQSRDISEAEYWAAVYSAFGATRKAFPRQEIETYESSRSGKTGYQRTKTSEFVAADRFHTIKETLENGKRSVEEMIQIGTARYCKDDLGGWKTAGCYVNPPAPLESALESKFRIDKSEKSTTYTRTSTFLLTETGRSEPTKFLTEDILVLNSDLLVRERTITKSALETRAILTRETRKHEYGLEPKPIEAPIK
jgi:hypothetical protein